MARVAPAAGAAAAARAERWTTGRRAPTARTTANRVTNATRVKQREPRPPAPQEELGSGEPVEVAGYLDLRDEGYGFLRVNGYLPSRDDVYVSVKQARQFGLRKGDHLTGCQPPRRPQREEPGAAADRHGQRRRPRAGAPAARGSRTSRRCSPTRSCASRARPTRPT